MRFCSTKYCVLVVIRRLPELTNDRNDWENNQKRLADNDFLHCARSEDNEISNNTGRKVGGTSSRMFVDHAAMIDQRRGCVLSGDSRCAPRACVRGLGLCWLRSSLSAAAATNGNNRVMPTAIMVVDRRSSPRQRALCFRAGFRWSVESGWMKEACSHCDHSEEMPFNSK